MTSRCPDGICLCPDVKVTGARPFLRVGSESPRCGQVWTPRILGAAGCAGGPAPSGRPWGRGHWGAVRGGGCAVPRPSGTEGKGTSHGSAFQEASPTRRGVDCGIGAGTLSVKGGVWGSRHLVTSSGHFSVGVPFAHPCEERVDWLGLSGGLGTSRGPPAFTLQYPRMPLGPSPSRRLP